MRRIRIMSGELIDRQYAGRDYRNQRVDLRETIVLPDGDIALKTDPDLIKTYFGAYALKHKVIPFETIENGKKSTSWASPSEVVLHNVRIYENPEIHGTDIIVVVQENNPLYTFRSMAKELGYYPFLTNSYYTKNERHKNNIAIGSKEFRKFDHIVKYDPKNLARSRFFGTTSPTNLITEGNNTTFGVELETADGFLGLESYFDLNVKCVYDGSLKDADGHAYGGEYVTGVLRGDLGFNQVNKICKELSKISTVNARCGKHTCHLQK